MSALHGAHARLHFGSRRDPFTGRPDSHPGLDISGNTGDPVYATADGRVATAARTGDYGNLVVIEHAFGLTTRYGHLSRIAVAPGTEVKRGHVIGSTDATADSVKDNPITPEQLAATLYERLGIDYRKVYETPIGRPLKFVNDAEPVRELYA